MKFQSLILISLLSFPLGVQAGGLVSFDKEGAKTVAEALNWEGIQTELLGYVECQDKPAHCEYRLGLGEEEPKAFSAQATKLLLSEFKRNHTVPRYANENSGVTVYWMSHVQCELEEAIAHHPETLEVSGCYFADDV